jgi:hypothetical protein
MLSIKKDEATLDLLTLATGAPGICVTHDDCTVNCS